MNFQTKRPCFTLEINTDREPKKRFKIEIVSWKYFDKLHKSFGPWREKANVLFQELWLLCLTKSHNHSHKETVTSTEQSINHPTTDFWLYFGTLNVFEVC